MRTFSTIIMTLKLKTSIKRKNGVKIDNSAFHSHPYCLSIFLTKELSNDKISVTMSK